MLRRRLTVEADADLAGAVADFVALLADAGGLHRRQAYWLRMATEELTVNIAQHGYRGRPGVIDLTGGVDGSRVWVRIEDDATPFDPRSHDPAPRLAAGPTGGAPGGFGLLLAMCRLDDYAYEYTGARNRSTLVVKGDR